MPRGKEIIVSSKPRGVFHEGQLSTDHVTTGMLPGAIMRIYPTLGELDRGRFWWAPGWADISERPQGPLGILMPDWLRGGSEQQSFAQGDACFLYTPYPGEELNVRCSHVGALTAGLLMINDALGALRPTTGTPEAELFMTLEGTAAAPSRQLVHCVYTGY